MQKLLIFTVSLLFCATQMVGCVPITATESRTMQQLDPTTIQQAHDQLVGATGA